MKIKHMYKYSGFGALLLQFLLTSKDLRLQIKNIEKEWKNL